MYYDPYANQNSIMSPTAPWGNNQSNIYATTQTFVIYRPDYEKMGRESRRLVEEFKKLTRWTAEKIRRQTLELFSSVLPPVPTPANTRQIVPGVMIRARGAAPRAAR
jgi:hypothetical protein